MTLFSITKYLYRKWRWAVTLLALALALPLPAAAQWRAPRPERTTARAIGVLELFPNGARRLVPVTFYYERRYYDAGLYRAAPVPFTLSPQTVYEVQRYGKPLGTFTVRNASKTSEGFWVAAGVFRDAPDPATLAKENKPTAPVVAEDPTRPVLHRREGSEGDRPVAKKSGTPAVEDDPERPRLQRKDQTEASQTRDVAGDSGDSDEAQDSIAGRPVLRRGKAAQEPDGAELSSPGAPAEIKPEAVQRQVAVSDAGPSEPQELLSALSETQRKQLESAARELARSELLRHAPMRGLIVPSAPTKGGASPQPAETHFRTGIHFEDEQFVPYDLDYSGSATVVFSGRYRPSASGASPIAGVAKERGWLVTIIARQEGDKLVKLYSAVSDPRELDLYPELRLVDAVDPEGNGRFALLFREQKRDGVSWLLGRVSGYQLQTIFETAAR